jgi:antitoxin ParD1/3/4
MGDMSFDIPPDLRRLIAERVEQGHYADPADYIRDLIRRDEAQSAAEQETPEYIAWVREQVVVGLASGVVDAEPEDVIEEIIAARRARRG